MAFEIDELTLAHQKVRDREYKAHVRQIKKMMRAKKRGRLPKKRIARIEKIAQAQLRAGTLPVKYPVSVHAMFGSEANFRSFRSKERHAIERAKRNGGRFLDDDLPQLAPHVKKA